MRDGQLEGIDLERTQLHLVQHCRMHPHEQRMEYLLFCTELKRKILGQKFNLQGLRPWLVIWKKYSDMFGFPEAYLGYFTLALQTRSKVALLHALDGCIEWLRSEMAEIKQKESDDGGERKVSETV